MRSLEYLEPIPKVVRVMASQDRETRRTLKIVKPRRNLGFSSE